MVKSFAVCRANNGILDKCQKIRSALPVILLLIFTACGETSTEPRERPDRRATPPAPVDAGQARPDAGVSMDSGATSIDSGTLILDSGAGFPDATPPADSGAGFPDATPPADSGAGFPDATPPADSGVGFPDATPPADSGIGFPDATPPTDSGVGFPDATPSADSGAGFPDAKPPADSGVGFPDATPPMDSGVPSDTGVVVDAGFASDSGPADAGGPVAGPNVCIDGWCFINPVPHPRDAYRIFGFGPDDYWVGHAEGIATHYTPAGWIAHTGLNGRVRAIWGAASDDVWLATDNGATWHWDGVQLSAGPSIGISASPEDMFGLASDDIWLTGSQTLHYDGNTWTRVTSAPTGYSVWASGTNDVWITDRRGEVHQYNGTTWNQNSPSTIEDMNAVWGISATDVWVAGDRGTIFRWDGTQWTEVFFSGNREINDIWVESPTDVWVVGRNSVYRYDGSSWRTLATTGVYRSVWGSASNEVFATGVTGRVREWNGTNLSNIGGDDGLYGIGSNGNEVWAGGYGMDLHWDGTALNQANTGSGSTNAIWFSHAGIGYSAGDDGQLCRNTTGTTFSCSRQGSYDFQAVHGTSDTDVWAVGTSGRVYHFDGNAWTSVNASIPFQRDLTGVWAMSPVDAWLVGAGSILRHWDGTTWTATTTGVTGGNYTAIDGTSPTNLWVVGNRSAGTSQAGFVLRRDSSGWSEVSWPSSQTLNTVLVRGPNDVYIAGASIHHWNGSTWTEIGTSAGTIQDMAETPAGIWAVGSNGALMLRQ